MDVDLCILHSHTQVYYQYTCIHIYKHIHTYTSHHTHTNKVKFLEYVKHNLLILPYNNSTAKCFHYCNSHQDFIPAIVIERLAYKKRKSTHLSFICAILLVLLTVFLIWCQKKICVGENSLSISCRNEKSRMKYTEDR